MSIDYYYGVVCPAAKKFDIWWIHFFRYNAVSILLSVFGELLVVETRPFSELVDVVGKFHDL